jgi:hypothetical protein
MGWAEVDDELALRMSFEDMQVLDEQDAADVRRAVLAGFPHLSPRLIDLAIRAAWQKLPDPKHREAFVEALRLELGDATQQPEGV